jgi:peptidoglycan hydrolase CwlO-like protein
MELTYVTIIVLASMIFVLSAMVGYLYWQQTRILQNVQSIALALASHIESTRPQVEFVEQVQQTEPEEEDEEEEEDDRVSVEEKVETLEAPPKESETDIDDLQDKTASELRELLTKKGIPFGKRESKASLLQLLKATS